MGGIGRKGERMSKKAFYITNAAAWIILLLAAAEHMSFENATPMQFVLVMGAACFVGYLALKSLVLWEKGK